MTNRAETEMVERCARAICNRRLPKPAYNADAFDNLKTWCEPGLERWEESQADLDGFYADARAVLEVLRDPTPDEALVVARAIAGEFDVDFDALANTEFMDFIAAAKTGIAAYIDAAISSTKQEEAPDHG